MKIKTSVICWIFLFIGITVNYTASAQTGSKYPYTVTGTVTDAETGKPLPGIHVDVPGISSAITDDNGHYVISIPKNNVILKVSGAAHAHKDIPVKGRNKIDVMLYEQNYKGAARTVYLPSGDVSSTQHAGSVSVIKEDNNMSVAPTPEKLIQGYGSGLNTLLRSGMPASGANMYLHGFNTMNAGAMPLFIIDGLPYENTVYAGSLIGNYMNNPLASIDIKDVESITILKDGTSLYGVKGANGVVLIKTLSQHIETKINVMSIWDKF